MRTELSNLVTKPWFIPTVVSAWVILVQGDPLEGIWLMMLALLTTQDEYFSPGKGGED